jgi:hypothetical protein
MARLSALATAVALIASLVASGTGTASAETMCNPVSNAARILKTPNPNDIHPDWKGESYVGLSWGVRTNGKRIKKETGTFLKGNLISPRGGVVNKGIYIVVSEWECSRT